jgi:hypothetical protein
LEFEEVESGKRLTRRAGESPDFFHSRLQVSPDGAYLLSAGWIWHPVDAALLYPIRNVMENPQVLDKPISLDLPEELFEVNSATFQGNNDLLLIGSNELENGPPFVGRFSLKEMKVEAKAALEAVPGTIMPIGRDYFVGFYEHPRLFEISSGKVVMDWPELQTGKQNSSIMIADKEIPPMAFDCSSNRFAVADAKGITVIQLG